MWLSIAEDLGLFALGVASAVGALQYKRKPTIDDGLLPFNVKTCPACGHREPHGAMRRGPSCDCAHHYQAHFHAQCRECSYSGMMRGAHPKRIKPA